MNRETDLLLRRWLINAKRSQIANYNAANRFSGRNYTLGIPAVVASGVVGTGVFASFEFPEVQGWIKVLAGGMSVLAAVLSSLQTFLRFDDRAARHRATAAEYGAIKREICQLLAAEPVSRDNLKSTISGLRSRFDDLSREVSLLKSPSGPIVGQEQTRASTPRKAGGVETSRIGSGVAPPGIDRVERRRTRAVRTATIRYCEERVQAARV